MSRVASDVPWVALPSNVWMSCVSEKVWNEAVWESRSQLLWEVTWWSFDSRKGCFYLASSVQEHQVLSATGLTYACNGRFQNSFDSIIPPGWEDFLEVLPKVLVIGQVWWVLDMSLSDLPFSGKQGQDFQGHPFF